MTIRICVSEPDKGGLKLLAAQEAPAGGEGAAVSAAIAKWAGKIEALPGAIAGLGELVQVMLPHGPVYERWVASGAGTGLVKPPAENK